MDHKYVNRLVCQYRDVKFKIFHQRPIRTLKLGSCIDLKLVALNSHSYFASFGLFKVHFTQNNENVIFTPNFATFLRPQYGEVFLIEDAVK